MHSTARLTRGTVPETAVLRTRAVTRAEVVVAATRPTAAAAVAGRRVPPAAPAVGRRAPPSATAAGPAAGRAVAAAAGPAAGRAVAAVEDRAAAGAADRAADPVVGEAVDPAVEEADRAVLQIKSKQIEPILVAIHKCQILNSFLVTAVQYSRQQKQALRTISSCSSQQCSMLIVRNVAWSRDL